MQKEINIFYKNIPLSKAKLKKKCKNILKLDIKFETIKTLKLKLNEVLINSWINLVRRTDYYEIVRTRKGKYDNISNLWYPPKEKITNYGRLNDIGEQIFYCSFGHNASLGSLEEIKAQIGDIVTQLFAVLIPNKSYRLCGVGGIESWMKSKDNIAKELYEINELNLKQKIGRKEFNKNKIIRECFDKIFIKNINRNEFYKYKLSIAIGKLYFENFNVQGIIYPSVASVKKSVNLALKPIISDKFIKFKYVRVIEILDIRKDGYILKLKNEAYNIYENGNFKWDFK